MGLKKEHICRLCLKVTKDEFEIDGIKKEMFEILLLKLNLNITENPIICKNCKEISKKSLDFKCTCIATEQIILSYSAGRKKVKHDIRVIYQDREKERTVLNGEFNVCRFCMTLLEKNNCFTLDGLMSDTLFEMLSQYMVEMDFNTTENPIACANCKKDMDDYFKFVLNCLDMEKKIIEYCKEEGTDNMGQVKLSNVLLFMFTDVLEYPDKSSQRCKIEQKHRECIFIEVNSGLIKQEESNIQDEEMIWDRTFYRNRSEINDKRKLTNNCDASEADMDEYNMSMLKKQQQHVLKNHSIFEGYDISVDRGIYPMYKCSFCAYETKHKSNLKKHMLIHKDVSEIKMHKCSLCTYEARQKNNLTRHMLVHKDVSEIKMYKCSLCPYEGKQKCHLRKHMIVHKDISEIKMYKCSLCAYETKRKDALKEHALVHKDVSEIKMYKCSLCAYEGKLKCNLTKHMIVHKDASEIKMYNCSLCPYEARRKGDLKVHMLVHKDVSEIKMYRCSYCTYECKRKPTLIRHMSVHKDISK